MKKSSNGKSFPEQFDDEVMRFLFRKHPVVMRKQILISSIILVVSVLPALKLLTLESFFGGLAIGFVLASVVMFWAWMGWYFSVFIVTDQRFIQVSQKGLFHRSFVDIGLDKIQMINYEIAGFQETLLGFGTILIQTYVGDLVIHEIHHPKEIQLKLSQLLRELQVNASGVPNQN